jgi:hypothetical protein
MKKSVKILIIVLCLIIVGLVVFIVLDKFVLTKNNEISDQVQNNSASELNLENNEISNSKNTNSNNLTLNDGNNEVSKENEITSDNKESIEGNSYDKDAYVKKIEEIENAYNDVDLKYGLVYIDEDDVPELIVDCNWYWQSIYKLENSKVVEISEGDAYGTHGSSGYSYIPKKNIIIRYVTGNDGYYYEIYNKNLEMQYSVFCSSEGKLMYYKGNSEKEITSEKFDELSYQNQNPILLMDEATMNANELIDKLTK